MTETAMNWDDAETKNNPGDAKGDDSRSGGGRVRLRGLENPTAQKLDLGPGRRESRSRSRALETPTGADEQAANIPRGDQEVQLLLNKIKSLEEVIKLKDQRRDEVEMELEIAKVEIKDLRNILEESLVQGRQDLRLATAVQKFTKTALEDEYDEEDIRTILAGESPRANKKRKKKSDKPQPQKSTYWDPEVVVLDELDQALAEVAELQGQVKQLEVLNAKLQERYRDAEVKHAMAQFKISKLEKARRELQLERAEMRSAQAQSKLEANKKAALERQNSLTSQASAHAESMEELGEADAQKRLLSAAQNGDLTTVTVLVDRFDAKNKKDGGDPTSFLNCRNRDGWTPLMLASARGHLPVVQKLLASNADPALTETDLGYTALHLAAWNNRPKVVRHLVADAGCPVDPEGENRRTPLMLASNWGAVAALKALLDLDAKPTRADIRGKTALDWARDKSIREMLREGIKQQERRAKLKEIEQDLDDPVDTTKRSSISVINMGQRPS